MSERPDAGPDGDGRLTFLERVLRIITEVHPGEGVTVVLMALNLFLVLTAYYMLKTIREALILTEGGAAVKTYSAAGQALLLLVLVPAFGVLASRVRRVMLLRAVTLFFVANIVLFFLAGISGLHVGVPFFVWVGIFNVMIVAQYWALANDIYTPEQGKRLFAVVALGSNVGAWLGALWAGDLIRRLGPYRLMLIAAGVLAACVAVAEVINLRQAERARTVEGAVAEQPLGREGGFELIWKDRYLLLIALLIVVLNVVNTTGEYILGKFVVAESIARFGATEATLDARQKFIGGFYGQFFSYVNLASFLLQMFAVSRIIRILGVGGAMFVHPLVAFVGYLSVFRWPGLMAARICKTFDNTIDYSLGKTAQQALWLPTSREAKYKAKQAVDAFFMRAGDVISAGLVFMGERLALAMPTFAAINVGLAVVWALILSRLAPENRRRMEEAAARAA
ncbi:MAG TPA: translocase [Vicinamibacteria bacterium]|nr:translocase [Vicinamibacteria bacterium]